MKPYSRLLGVFTVVLFMFSCKKELSQEVGNPIPVDSLYNWSFKDSGSVATDIKAGYTDTSFIRSEGDSMTFIYEGTSSDQNKGIVFQVAGRPLAVGLYSGEQVAFGYFQGSSLVYTNINANSDFALSITYLTQDSISATFSGHVQNSKGILIQLNEGYLRTRIGTPVEDTDSVGNLICSSIVVNGEMKPQIEVDISNYVDMEVHVT